MAYSMYPLQVVV